MLKSFISALLVLSGLSCMAESFDIPCHTRDLEIILDASTPPGSEILMEFQQNGTRLVAFSVGDESPDEIYGKTDICVRAVDGLHADTIIRRAIKMTGNSARLRAKMRFGNGNATISLRGSETHKPIVIPFSTDSMSVLNVRPRGNAILNSITPKFTVVEPLRQAGFNSVESLAEYLAASRDPAEGFWKYYDRKTDPLRAAIGGKYTLATVRTADGGYDIIYLAGADARYGLWQPLLVKGHLTPDGFDGCYLLSWRDADGAEISHETSATIEGDLLILSFPYWKATLRFARCEKP